ncbi:GRIP and coiled-coil domain-containing protein 2 [Astyanax mexicanus]|uniref:GRIP and coiled-coil domain-containing protein 2 n=1 Tax=Astyanax mexicanus TaxID=7994 RepID=UPI0020CAE029|nr:GRIP and coiled-coil domain-containing protein 2 [Astyanax mexicanus]
MQDSEMECVSPSPGAGIGKSKLDTLSKEDLIKFAKKQMAIMQKLKSKCGDLEKEVGVLKASPSGSSDGSIIQELTERMDAVLLEKAETQQTLLLLRKENEKVSRRAEEAEGQLAALREEVKLTSAEHAEKIRIMEQMLQTSESKYKEQIESFKKMESEQNEKEEIQRRRMTEEFTSNVQSLRQEYETKISNLQQDLELAKKEWTAETEAQIKVLQTELKESQDGSASLCEEMARLSVRHEAELRDLEEQLEVNAAHFEMERERLLLLNEELAEQLALKESYLQDVQEEEEDLNRNGAQKTSGPTSTPHSSTEDDPDNDETDGLRLTLHDLQSQNTMVQEELTFLRNVKMELENEVQHLKEEFTMEKEELEFKLNELQMTKEDCSSSGMEIDAQTESDERNTKSFVHEPEHDQELQQLKEVHQLELRELESRLVLDAEREREVVMQELRELRQRSEVLTEEKNAAVTEYEHTKQILHTLELELGERTEDFVKQYDAMKERAAAAVRELQEQLNEKDTIIKNLESLTKAPEISEQNAQIPTCPEPAAELPEPLEGGYVSVSWDEDNQVTLEKVVTHLHHIKDECKTRPADWARLSFQKLEDLSVVLDSALGEREDITKRMADLESRLSSSLTEKEQLSEQCDALVQNLDALRAAEEQCQTAARELSNTAGQEKAELQKQLHLVVEERDAVRKDMETIEQKLLDAQTRISAVLEQEYSTPVAEQDDISVLVNRLVSRVKEETAVLTQQLKEQSEQLIKISSQSGSEQRAAGLGAEVELLQPVAGSLQERQAETQCQDVRDSQGTEITAALMVKEDSPDDPGSPETDDLKRFQQKLSEKDWRISQLKEEISQLQESNLSALSEHTRQTEILEKESKEKDERMNKIKAVAVKARKELEASKKEASDLRAELDALKAERDRLSDSVKVIIHGAEDYKNLMNDYDMQTELLDKEKEKLEAAERLNADLTKRLQAAIEQNKQLCSEREDTMARMDTLQNNVRQLEAQLLELQRIKSGLERDLETERLLKEQKIKDHQSAVKEAEDLNALLQKQKQQLQQTEQELEQLRKDAQQSTLLDMEMADYERLVKELNLQLSEKDRLIEEQDKLAQTQRDQEQKLSQEIESLKTLVDTGEEKASKMKQLLVKTKKDLADAKKEEASQMIVQSSLRGELEASQQQLENYKIQCSELTADRHRLQEQLKCVNDQQQKALSSYQHQLSSLQEELSSKTAELKSTMSEFEGYKVRVHNVLKQQKSRSSTQSDGEFSKQEREHMEALLEQLHSKLQESQLNLQSSSTELQQLHTEHDMLLERHNKMLQQTVAKEAELRERVLSLHSENAALRSEHSQAVSQLTAQAEALRSCFREQTHHLQEEHRSTVDTLQQQISRLEARLFQLQKEPASTGSAPVLQSRRPQLDRKLTELPLFDLESMAREEGEGMETTETECITAGTPTPTLEQLLTSPDPKQEPFVWQVEPTKEELTQKLSTASRSMEHVNSLLHESEATNAILLEQNNLLKSELRRLERNQEREKSVANLEYLKNVLLQFIFLRSGSEKQALLPVIHTMLQLSPEEKSKLAAIAQGEEEAAGSRASGWTSYLHSWSGIR